MRAHIVKIILGLIVVHLIGINMTFAADGVPSIRIYNAYMNPAVPFASKGYLAMADGKKRGIIPTTKAVRAANESLTVTSQYFFNAFGLFSFDGKGSTIEASVNVQKIKILDFFGLKQNAAWLNEKTMFLFGGGGKFLDDFERAIDVVAHEYTHAVIDNSSRLEMSGQSGALNEHFADVFGAIVENQLGRSQRGQEFLIGDSILSEELKQSVARAQGRQVVALRDMLNPERGLDAQPGHISKIPAQFAEGCKASNENDYCGVHSLSGIPNRAAANIMQKLGIKRTQQLFFEVMISRLGAKSNFADYAQALRNTCSVRLASSECAVVHESLMLVGI